MVKSIEIGKYYRVFLIRSVWKEEVVTNVRISGVTRKNSTEIFSAYDVKEELFRKFNIGMNAFLDIYNDEVDVYICNLVEKLDPIDHKKDVFFIPKTAVDMILTEELRKTYNISFTIDGINYCPEGFVNIDKYIKSAAERLAKEIKYVKEFVSPTMEINGTKTEMYRPNSEICADRHINEEIYKNFLNSVIERQRYEENTRNSFIEARIRCDKTTEAYNLKMKELDSQYNTIAIQQNANVIMNDGLSKVQEKLEYICEQLRAKGQQLNVHVPTFDQLLDEANIKFGPSIPEDTENDN